MLSCRTQHTYIVEILWSVMCKGNMLSCATGIRICMTRECYNVWIDTNNDMSKIDMMMCEPS